MLNVKWGLGHALLNYCWLAALVSWKELVIRGFTKLRGNMVQSCSVILFPILKRFLFTLYLPARHYPNLNARKTEEITMKRKTIVPPFQGLNSILASLDLKQNCYLVTFSGIWTETYKCVELPLKIKLHWVRDYLSKCPDRECRHCHSICDCLDMWFLSGRNVLFGFFSTFNFWIACESNLSCNRMNTLSLCSFCIC